MAAQRHEEGLADLRTAAEGWRALGVSSPAGATWRIPAVVACTALGRQEEAAKLAAEQLDLARAAGIPATLGVSLRIAFHKLGITSRADLPARLARRNE